MVYESKVERINYETIMFTLIFSGNLNWSHEPDIQSFVETAMRDVINMYGLKITLVRETSVAALCPDFWVVTHQGIPIGIYLFLAFIVFYCDLF